MSQQPVTVRADLEFVDPEADPDEVIEIRPEGEAAKQTSRGFFRGEVCNFHPIAADQASDRFCEHFLLKGHLPDRPVVTRKSKITAFGSCFAQNITRHLEKLGFDLSKNRDPQIHVSTISEGLVNVYSILTQFSWALEDKRPDDNLWYGPNATLFSLDEDVRRRTRNVFLETDVFVITIGVSELWYDEVSGGVFWRAVPKAFFDPTRHKFRVCSPEETTAALLEIRRIIRAYTNAEIIFTLSPIPLVATFRDQACIVSNSASKAILRAGLDEFFRNASVAADQRCRYFPAYEAVTTLFPSPFMNDGHHPHPFVIAAVMKMFEAFYCETDLTRAEAEAIMREARARSADWTGRQAALGTRSGEWVDPELEVTLFKLDHMNKAYAAAIESIGGLKSSLDSTNDHWQAAYAAAIDSIETLKAEKSASEAELARLRMARASAEPRPVRRSGFLGRLLPTR